MAIIRKEDVRLRFHFASYFCPPPPPSSLSPLPLQQHLCRIQRLWVSSTAAPPSTSTGAGAGKPTGTPAKIAPPSGKTDNVEAMKAPDSKALNHMTKERPMVRGCSSIVLDSVFLRARTDANIFTIQTTCAILCCLIYCRRCNASGNPPLGDREDPVLSSFRRISRFNCAEEPPRCTLLAHERGKLYVVSEQVYIVKAQKLYQSNQEAVFSIYTTKED